MTRAWWAKCSFLCLCIIGAVLYVVPTVFNLDLEKTRFPVKQKINLGLDLQGGLYLVMGVNFDKVFLEVAERQLTSLKDRLKEKNLAFNQSTVLKEGFPSDDPRIQVTFGPNQKDAALAFIREEFTLLRLTDEKPDAVQFGLAQTYRSDVREKTLNQSIQVIRNRVDEFGVAEPAISSQGNDRVVVELPGIKEVERAKELIGRTARLEFKIVDDEKMTGQQLVQLVSELEKEKNIQFKEGQKFSEYVALINRSAQGKIPDGSQIAFERGKKGVGTAGEDHASRVPYLIFSKADVTGDDLQDAQVTFNQESQRPEVAFELNPRGAVAFEKLTGTHIGKRLAIVLDGIVHSAPVINSKIGGRGVISLGQGNYDLLLREAKDLAIVLRAGALPAQLDLLEQRVIGPTLGQDSIRKGVNAGVIGCLFIFLFMIIYYRVSGAVAVFSLVLNALFALAILIGLDATLTLPGIAGLALTIGMAVDSNVIIFERIRDELDEGRSAAAAIPSGFDKAFSSIFDANITHGIIALILLNYGTGPIKGFAISLLIGIGTTLFTAVTVCKLIFDGYLMKKGNQLDRISI